MKIAAVQLGNRCGDSKASFAAAERLPGEDEGFVTAEVVPGRTRKTPLRPAVHDGWLHAGSRFSRKVLGPLDTVLGRRHYERRVKALRARR